ncbi:type II toxin-antitoxin system PemK/MazF family toxin [Thermoflexibacter ruber]|uniref:mRNA interferase MazF n=1 Tax=Thermoflexibacter ruber TaxID=1003 RepID=A0A1I2G921_9BACT|nr:type II toxin-antitoxin system PemK/MazF family toxin [Thermoflexibacter ruber]SFF13246.1 mRNA interferase MazF [Thermoflexibacter ruber]
MYKQREIVLVPFPYSDLSNNKKRPVLIVSNNDYNQSFEDVLVCVITSNDYKDAYSVDLSNHDLEIGILPESSIVKAHKLFTIHQSKIIKKFSMVKGDYFELIKTKIHSLVKKS